MNQAQEWLNTQPWYQEAEEIAETLDPSFLAILQDMLPKASNAYYGYHGPVSWFRQKNKPWEVPASAALLAYWRAALPWSQKGLTEAKRETLTENMTHYGARSVLTSAAAKPVLVELLTTLYLLNPESFWKLAEEENTSLFIDASWHKGAKAVARYCEGQEAQEDAPTWLDDHLLSPARDWLAEAKSAIAKSQNPEAQSHPYISYLRDKVGKSRLYRFDLDNDWGPIAQGPSLRPGELLALAYEAYALPIFAEGTETYKAKIAAQNPKSLTTYIKPQLGNLIARLVLGILLASEGVREELNRSAITIAALLASYGKSLGRGAHYSFAHTELLFGHPHALERSVALLVRGKNVGVALGLFEGQSKNDATITPVPVSAHIFAHGVAERRKHPLVVQALEDASDQELAASFLPILSTEKLSKARVDAILALFGEAPLPPPYQELCEAQAALYKGKTAKRWKQLAGTL